MLEFFNSAFVTAFFGAIAGALSAAGLASYANKRNRLLDEILACNVAIGQCISTTNSFAALKRQAIKPLSDRYLLEQVRFLQSIISKLMGYNRVVVVYFDLQLTQEAWTPIDALNKIITERVLTGARPSILSAALTQAIHNFQTFTVRRNELVGRFYGRPIEENLSLYFGYDMGGRRFDSSYPDLLKGLVCYIDDCLYFSLLLAEVLNRHGNNLAWKYGRNAPKINKADFSPLDGKDILPDVSQYPDFERQFRPKMVEMVVTM